MKRMDDSEQQTARIAEARRMLRTMGETGVGMTCGQCGHTDDLARFTQTPVFGQLPIDEFQCPTCGWSVKRQHETPTVYPSGFIMPGPVKLVTIGSRM